MKQHAEKIHAVKKARNAGKVYTGTTIMARARPCVLCGQQPERFTTASACLCSKCGIVIESRPGRNCEELWDMLMFDLEIAKIQKVKSGY